jgi:hypothetical protein
MDGKVNTKRVVVCAALRNKKTGQIIAGARHYDSVMRSIFVKYDVDDKPIRDKDWIGAEQGFIDQYGVFMDRKEAWKVAKESDQIKWGKEYSKETLYSENLY